MSINEKMQQFVYEPGQSDKNDLEDVIYELSILLQFITKCQIVNENDENDRLALYLLCKAINKQFKDVGSILSQHLKIQKQQYER